jgi:anti-anti-sigma factor
MLATEVRPGARCCEGIINMSKPQLTIDVRKVGDETAVLDIRGEVTGFAENALMDAYSQATSMGARTIALNFTELQYMNSSGIGLLVTLLIRAQRQKQRLVAFGLSEHYVQIFELTRLNEAIGIFEEEKSAVAA